MAAYSDVHLNLSSGKYNVILMCHRKALKSALQMRSLFQGGTDVGSSQDSVQISNEEELHVQVV